MCRVFTADRITAHTMADTGHTTEASSLSEDTTTITTTVGIISTDMVSAPAILEAVFTAELDDCENRFAANSPHRRRRVQRNRAAVAKPGVASSAHCHGWLLCQAGIGKPAQRNPQAIRDRRC